jgi:hypothetical protein
MINRESIAEAVNNIADNWKMLVAIACFLFLFGFFAKTIGDNFIDEITPHDRYVFEIGYFMGQRDAINGKIIILYIKEDSSWVWEDKVWEHYKNFYDPIDLKGRGRR